MNHHEHRPRRRFGQNFLHDPAVIDWIVDRASAAEASCAVEIGPGQGALTGPLAERFADLVAIEIDRDLVAGLEADMPENVRVAAGDALDIDWPAATSGWFSGRPEVVAVGNLPYNVATPICRRLLASGRFTRLVLMFQDEVGQRLMATSGSAHGHLAVERWLRAEVLETRTVGPGAFRPEPKVQSRILVLQPRSEVLPEDLISRTLELASTGFRHRRKRLLGNLRRETSLEPSIFDDAFERLGIGRDARAEELSPADFLSLARQLENSTLDKAL